LAMLEKYVCHNTTNLLYKTGLLADTKSYEEQEQLLNCYQQRFYSWGL
jgi:hypothetical protein